MVCDVPASTLYERALSGVEKKVPFSLSGVENKVRVLGGEVENLVCCLFSYSPFANSVFMRGGC